MAKPRLKRLPKAALVNRLYFRHLPHRCSGGEVGPIGNCMACGAYDAETCRAPPREAASQGQTHFPPSNKRRGGVK